MKTLYIVPAWSIQAGRCRIVQTGSFAPIHNAAADYRERPQVWHEVGIMNSQGKLVAYSGSAEEYDYIQSCEPLSAGMVFKFD